MLTFSGVLPGKAQSAELCEGTHSVFPGQPWWGYQPFYSGLTAVKIFIFEKSNIIDMILY